MPPLDFKHYGVLAVYAAITFLINLLFSKRSQIDAWCEANPKLAALAKFCRGAGVDPWAIVQSLVLLFTKQLPDYQKQTLVNLRSRSLRGVGMLLTFALMALSGLLVACGVFASKSTLWPNEAKCLPSKDSLIESVAEILKVSDYQSSLEQLAIKQGGAAVECAVQTLIDELTKPTARPTDEAAAVVARGRAFLSKTGTKLERAQ